MEIFAYVDVDLDMKLLDFNNHRNQRSIPTDGVIVMYENEIMIREDKLIIASLWS